MAAGRFCYTPAADMTMERRVFLATVSGGLLAMPLGLSAQPKAGMARIGLITPTSPASAKHLVEAFRQGLREMSQVEGKTCMLEVRYGESRSERMSQIARELVALKVDVIVASTDLVIAATRRETRTIPIVMAFSTDPVGTGFVASFAHPGGNVTGLSGVSPDLGGKRIELLKQCVPGLSRVAILWNPDARGAVLDYKETEAAATSLGVAVQSLELLSEADLEPTFSTLRSGQVQAFLVPAGNPVALT